MWVFSFISFLLLQTQRLSTEPTGHTDRTITNHINTKIALILPFSFLFSLYTDTRSINHILIQVPCTYAFSFLFLFLFRNKEHPQSRRGTLIIQSEEVRELKYSVSLHLGGKHLDKKDLFGKSDPFVIISRSAEGGQYVLIF